MIILDGKKLAKKIEEEEKVKVQAIKERGVNPSLAIIFVGKDEASEIYINKKKKAGARIGVKTLEFNFSEDDNTEAVIKKIGELNGDKKIHGIIVQFPLPKSFDKEKIIMSISPEKDVDGVHPLNWGRLAYKRHDFIPCTPAAIMEMLHYYNIPIKGKDVVIVGKSEIVGKPLAILMMNEDATLTIAHKETKNLKEYTRRADIIISATGVPHLIKKDMIKQGVTLIDVGIIRTKDGIRGDIDFDDVSSIAGSVTPVPGGVGPVTVSMLLKNVVLFAERS